MKKLNRGPAVISQKDFGMLCAYTGISKQSKVLEIGCGSGFMTVQIARIAKEVVSIDRREEFLKIAERNAKILGLENIKFVLSDPIKDGIGENGFDICIIDIPNPEEILDECIEKSSENTSIFCHCLSIEQAKRAYLKLKDLDASPKMIEVIEREYVSDERRTRPEHIGIIHTGYLVFGWKKLNRKKQMKRNSEND